MRRFFVKNLFFSLFVNVLVMPVWVFLIDNTVQNRVGAKEYGIYASFGGGLALVFSIILDFGITNYNIRRIAQNPEELKTLFPSMLSAKFLLMLAYTILLLIIGLLAHYSLREMLLLSGIILIQAITNLVAFIRSNVSALHHFKTDSMLSVTGRLLMILICGFLLVYPPTARHFKIEWFVITQVVCYFLSAIIALATLNHIHPIQFRFSFHRPTILKIIRDTLPYATVIFLMAVYTRSDIWLITRLCGKSGHEQAGIYAASYRWLDVGNSFAIMFSTILLPMFGRMIAEKKRVNQMVHLSVNLLLPISLMVAAGAIFFGNDFMHWRYASATGYYSDVFSWVMGSFPAICLMYVYATLLLANGQLKILNNLALGGSVLNLTLNFIVIPHFEAYGAAITGFITQSVMAAGFIFCCVRNMQLNVQLKWMLAHTGYFLLIIAAGFSIQRLPCYWMLQGLLFAMVCFLFMFTFRFISVQSVKQLLSKK